jgi:phage gp29-like protein
MKILLGPDGEPIETSLLTEELAGPEMAGVRSPMSEHPSVGLTPEKLAGLLREAEDQDPQRWFALAEEMEEKEPQYLATLGVRKRSVAQLEITVDPASENARDVEIAKFIEQFLARESLEDELFDILDAIGKGFSLSEIIWDTSEKQWLPKQIKWVDPRWVQFELRDLTTPLIKTLSGPVPLTPYKFVPFTAKAKSGLPVRSGLARPIAWVYLFKNFDVKGWVQFAELYGQPIRLGKYHSGATAAEKRSLLRAVSNISRDAAAIIPQGMEMEFIQGKAGGEDIHEKLARYLDQSISKLVLGQTATTDAIAGGHAVGQEHNDVRGDIERSDARQLAACINQCVVRPIVDLNYGPQKAYPRIRIGRSEQTNVPQLADALAKLVPLGLKVSAQEVRGKIGVSEPADDADVLGQAAPAPEDVQPPVPLRKKPDLKAVASQQQELDVDVVDLMVAQALEDDGWEEVMSPMIDPLIASLEAENIQDWDTLIGRIEALRDKMDVSALTNALANSGAFVRSLAYAGVDDLDGSSDG